MRQYIQISKSLRDEMVARFNVSDRSIRSILHFITNNQRAEEARHYALEHGGRLIREEYVPVCRTDESSPEKMVHIFQNGFTVEISLVDSSARVIKAGKTVRTEEHLTLHGWSNLLFEVQQMSA